MGSEYKDETPDQFAAINCTVRTLSEYLGRSTIQECQKEAG